MNNFVMIQPRARTGDSEPSVSQEILDELRRSCTPAEALAHPAHSLAEFCDPVAAGFDKEFACVCAGKVLVKRFDGRATE